LARRPVGRVPFERTSLKKNEKLDILLQCIILHLICNFIIDNVQTIDDGLQNKCEFKLRIVELIGQRHKFKLELFYFPNIDTDDDQKQSLFIFNRSNRRSTTHDKIYRIIMPLKALYWLREQMAELLVLYDGTEPIEMEAPAKIPKQIQYYTSKVSKVLDE
jgi:hypothetical protein